MLQSQSPAPGTPPPRGGEVVGAVPIMLVIESLALLGTAAYLRTIRARTRLKTQTQVGVFTGSLALALTVIALFVPAAAARSQDGHFLFSNRHSTAAEEPVMMLTEPMLGFWVWAASLACIGVALHLVTIARWRASLGP